MTPPLHPIPSHPIPSHPSQHPRARAHRRCRGIGSLPSGENTNDTHKNIKSTT